MQDKDSLFHKLNRETAQIEWQALQPFFARGQAIRVDSDLDLVAVAMAFASDDSASVQGWMAEQRVAPVSEQEAGVWSQTNPQMWAVVVAPFVLVQPGKAH
jgi:hypothetical protein